MTRGLEWTNFVFYMCCITGVICTLVLLVLCLQLYSKRGSDATMRYARIFAVVHACLFLAGTGFVMCYAAWIGIDYEGYDNVLSADSINVFNIIAACQLFVGCFFAKLFFKSRQ